MLGCEACGGGKGDGEHRAAVQAVEHGMDASLAIDCREYHREKRRRGASAGAEKERGSEEDEDGGRRRKRAAKKAGGEAVVRKMIGRVLSE